MLLHKVGMLCTQEESGPSEVVAAVQGRGASSGGDGTSPPTAGFSGGGATAFPAQAAGSDLHGEHLSDFDGKVGTAEAGPRRDRSAALLLCGARPQGFCGTLSDMVSMVAALRVWSLNPDQPRLKLL